jgi:large subunit ribosomal protein L24
MKSEFTKSWKSSKQPRKQRKYVANAPLHLKRKLLGVNLSKELRDLYGKRTIVLKKGDTVKVLKGKFKNKTGKVTQIHIKMVKVYVEGIQTKKQDGSKVNVKLHPSNLQIIQANTDDGKRGLKSQEKKKVIKTETSEKIKSDSKTKTGEKK